MLANRSRVAPTPRRIALALDPERLVAELTAAMLATAQFDAMGPHGGWLLERYREIVPTVLPDALHCMETGRPIAAESLAVIRRSAVAMRDSPVPLSVVLRGSTPALRAFGAFIQARDTRLGPQDLTALMGRAALIAKELGASWAEAWAEAERSTPAHQDEGHADFPGFFAVHGTVPSPTLEMLAYAAAGRSTEKIAEATDYSPHAVKWHLARLMREWNVDTRTSLVAVAFARGVLRAKPVDRPFYHSSTEPPREG